MSEVKKKSRKRKRPELSSNPEHEAKVLAAGAEFTDGFLFDEIKEKLTDWTPTAAEFLQVANSLLQKKRLNLIQQDDGNVRYKIIDMKTAAKFQGLGAYEMLVYKLIEQEGNMGIWVRNLRKKSNLDQARLNKVTKTLASRKLIKSERSIAGKNKKVWMLYELEPAKEITGGAWYTNNEFDVEFINALYQTCLGCLSKKPQTAEDIAAFIKKKGCFTVQVSKEDISHILMSMFFDRVIEEVPKIDVMDDSDDDDDDGIELGIDGDGGERKRKKAKTSQKFRVVKAGPPVSTFTSIPCAHCPVADNCHPGGVVSPEGCVYFKRWMEF